MQTYFVSYSFLTVDGERRYRETVLDFPHPVGHTKESLQIVKAALVLELLDENYNVIQPDIHLISLQYQHSRPSGACAP